MLMAVMMVFTMMPSMAWADDTNNETAAGSEAGNIVASGDCGDSKNVGGAESVKWELSTDGTLTISGTGAMAAYKNGGSPWKDKQITFVKLDEGVTSIGRYAFQDCSTLEKVSLPQSLTTIGLRAFQNCTSLSEVAIPTNVNTVGTDAFGNCTNLKKIIFNNVLTEENLSAYIDNCIALQEVAVANAGSTVTAKNGVFYSKDEETLIRCLPSKAGKLEVLNTVKTIKEKAFNKCSALEELTLPETMETAYNGILFNCSNLRYLELKGVKKVVNYAFEGCTALDQLVLSAGLTSYAERSVTPKLICFRGTEEQWEAAATETVRTKLADKGTVVVYNYDDQTGAEATITVQPEASVNIGLGQTKYLSVTAREEEGTQYYYRWFKKTGNETKKVSNLSEDARYKVDSSTKGTTNYYCEVVTVKDGKTAVTRSNEAVVTVGDLTTNFTGSGTQADPYQLTTSEHMSELAGLVNSGISFSGKYFKLTADITLPEGWTSIGCKINTSTGIEAGKNLYAFSGTIDGAKEGTDGGCWTLTVPKGGLPLLGYVKGATVKNLNLAGEKINGYGLVNNFEGVGLSGNAITIENVTIKAGTKIVKSGLLGANITENPYAGVSAAFVASIKNCTIEEGVVIGCDGDQNMIGGFAGRMQGTIENCKNYGTVKGKNVVGGIIGTRDNSMQTCTVQNCSFYGSVIGEENVGGIVGSGYMTNNTLTASAPNGQRINIRCNTVGESATVTGKNNVGGILGSDLYVVQVWDNVTYSLVGNSFAGKIVGTTNIGGIIGFYDSLNKFDNVAGNVYTKNCGAKAGIGMVKYVDTNAKTTTKKDGTLYFNTEKGTSDCPTVQGCNWRSAHNRTDDPLGADKEKLAKAVDTIPTEAFCYELVLKSGTPKAEYYIGKEFSFADAVFTAKMTDGTEEGIDTKKITVSGYNKNSHSVQTVILSYGYAQYELQVAVLKKSSGGDTKETIEVSFTLLGDDSHNEDEAVHTLSKNNLKTWITKETYTLDINATAGYLFKEALKKHNVSWEGTDDNKYNTLYISGVENPTTGDVLSEFDNGPYSGWMYTINGKHPEVGIDARFLNDGEEMIFHYTDDYTKEEGSDKWNTPGGEVIEEVKDVTTDTKTGTTTAPTEVKVTEKVNADGTKSKVAEVKVSADNQKEILKQAKANKSKEIILSVATKAIGDAIKADVTID